MTRQVTLGYKCVHEGCQKIICLSLGKGTTFTCRETVESRAETSNLGAKSFRAALLMLYAQSFIFSPILRWISRCASPRFANKELQIIANIKEKYELYLRNIMFFAAVPPRESKVKNTLKTFLLSFDSVCSTRRRGNFHTFWQLFTRSLSIRSPCD